MAFERRMRSLLIEIYPEFIELALEIDCIPEEDLVKVLPTYGANQPLDERMRHGNTLISSTARIRRLAFH